MRFIAITLLLFSSFSTLCQEVISGRVVDAESGEGLIGAHVYLLKNWRVGATTDIEGRFSLNMSADDLQDSLVVSYVGFEEQVLSVENASIIRLNEIETMGKTVVVTAKPLISEEFKYVEIKKIDIYTNPAAKADPILAVNSLPSATTTDESANISLRGSSPIETGVFLNNVPVYDAVRYSQLNGIGTFSIFSTSIIKSVTVFPGNPPLEFGNTTSGIISMQTDDRILDGNANSLIVSLANIGFSREQQLNENQSLKIFTNWQPSGAIKSINEKSLEDIKSFSSNDLGLYWYGNSDLLNWKVLSYSVIEGYKFNFEHPSFNGIFDQRKQRSFLISSVEKPTKTGSLSLNNGLSISNGDYSYSNVAFNVKKKDLFLGANYLLSKKDFSIKTGVSYDYRFSEIDGNFHEVFYALDEEHPTIQLSEEDEIQVFEGYTYFKYYFSEKIAFGSSLRKNIPIDDIKSYLSSQANVSYTTNNWVITLGAGNYHKHGLEENTGEPFSSTSEQKSLDIKREKNGFQIALSLFDKVGKINDVNYQARGIELFAEHRFSSKLNASTSITLLDASSDEQGYTYDLSYFLRGNISYAPGRFWTIESTLVARQGTTVPEVISSTYDDELEVYQPVYSENLLRLSTYANVGLAVSKIFAISEKMNVIAFASMNNLLDRNNTRGFSYNFDYSNRDENLFSRRTGYLGVIINF